MPATPSRGAVAPRKKENKRSWWKKQLGDLKDVAVGAPGAVYQTATAIDQALPSGPKWSERLLFERKGRHNDFTALKEQGRSQLQGIKKLGDKEAWKEDTALNLLTGLGLAASMTGVGGAVGTATRAAKGVPAKKPPTRIITARPKNDAEAKKWAKTRGLDPEKITTKTTFKVEVPAAKPATTRLVQKGADKARAAVPSWQRRKVGAHLRSEQDILNRLVEPTQGGFKDSVGKLKRGEFNRARNPRALIREANAGARGAVLFRPGYIGPNLFGANVANLIQMGAKYPGMVVSGRKTTAGLTPEARDRMRNLHGSGISQSALDVDPSFTPDAENPQGPVATFMSGVGESLGKVTDRRSRDRAFLFEAEKQGYKSVDEIERLLDPDQVFENPQLRRDLLQIVKRTEPAAIKFSRTSGGNKLDRGLAENIFLYKWLTGSARYTGRVAGQHPITTATLANAPQGEDLTELLGAENIPDFMKSFIPFGEGSKWPQVVNSQSLSLWETLPEAAEIATAMYNKDFRQGIRALAPVQKTAGLAATGYHSTSGKELSEYDFSEDKQRLSEGGGAPLSERLLWALNEAVGMSPYSKLSDRYRSGLYPTSDREEFMRIFTPLGGLYRRNVDPKVAKFIASGEKKANAPRKRKTRSGW